MENNVIIPDSFDNLVLETIYKRRAIRKFKNKIIDKAILEKILDAGRMAPSAINKQPWRFYTTDEPAFIERMSKAILNTSKMDMFKAGIKEVAHLLTLSVGFNLKDGINFFKASDPVFHTAPIVVFISADRHNEWASLDIGMCVQNMLLAAKSLGIDSCPVGFGKYIDHTEEYKYLNVPENHQIHLAVIFGYGDEEGKLHERKKDNLESILLY